MEKKSSDNAITQSILFPLRLPLCLTGVSTSWTKPKVSLCTALWFMLCMQAYAYVLYLRISHVISTSDAATSTKLYECFATVFHVETVILDFVTYLLLVLKLGPFLDSLWIKTKALESCLTCPRMKSVVHLCIVSVCYIFTTVRRRHDNLFSSNFIIFVCLNSPGCCLLLILHRLVLRTSEERHLLYRRGDLHLRKPLVSRSDRLDLRPCYSHANNPRGEHYGRVVHVKLQYRTVARGRSSPKNQLYQDLNRHCLLDDA